MAIKLQQQRSLVGVWSIVQDYCVSATSEVYLITGHPRSGTHYTAKLVRRLGYSASIEGRWMGPGTGIVSSWKHAMPGDFRNRLFARPLRQDFAGIIHQVRHPLDVIASSITLTGRSVDHIKRYLDIPEPTRHKAQPLTLCMRSWLGWNRLIEAQADWRFQLERLPEVFPEFCNRLRLPVQDFPDIGKRNMRRHADLTWRDLERADRALAFEVREMAQRYGYNDAA